MPLPRNSEYVYYIDEPGSQTIYTPITGNPDEEASPVETENTSADESTGRIIPGINWNADSVVPIGDGTEGTEGTTPPSYPNVPVDPIPEIRYKTIIRKSRAVVENFDPEALEALQNQGIQFIAVYTDGTEDEVDWTEVYDPRVTSSELVTFEADNIGAASNQHFWKDNNGAHVTDDTQSNWNIEYSMPGHGTLANPTDIRPWHNILMNSLGILLRRGLINLVSMSKSAIAFYDGSGNQNENITAFFGRNNAQIGRSTENHIILDNEGITAYDGEGNVAPLQASNIAAAEADIDHLQADTADIATIRANSAKVANLTADALTAATAYVAALNAASVTANDISANKATIADLITGSVTTSTLKAASAYISALNAAHVTANDISADKAVLAELISGDVTATTLRAASAYIELLEASGIDADDLSAASAYIDALTASNITAQNISADHATVGTISADYLKAADMQAEVIRVGQLLANYVQTDFSNVNVAWIQNGTIKDGAITNAMINSVSANKLTAGTIDASKITVTNLTAEDISVSRINGQTVTGKNLTDALSQHESDISDLDDKIDTQVEALNDRIDGAIETFTGTAVPTLNNTPASGWNTTKLRDQHVGDVYYVVNSNSQQNGYCYRFTKSGSTYSWQLIKDSDVTAALSRLQTAEGKIGTIEQFDSDISAWKTDTDEELASMKTAHNTLAGRVSTAEGTLSNKVDTTTFNTLSQTVEGNRSSIQSLTTEQTELSGLIADTQETVANISIGGRNLVWDTAWNNTGLRWQEWGAPSTREIVESNGRRWLHIVTSGSRYQGYQQSPSYRNGYGEISGGDVLTVSAIAYAAAACTTSIWGFHWNKLNDNGSSTIVNQSWFTESLTTEPKRFTETITVPDGVTGFNIMVGHNAATSVDIWIADVKLERGNKATDWTPAPEDVEANALASGIEYIAGTQTAATNLWTGKTKESALVAGKSIAYRLPYAGTGTAATLNLTLSGGGTTGAKAINMPYSTSSNTASMANITTHYPAGSVIPMTYDGTKWVVNNYNTNVDHYDRVVHNNALKAASANASGKSYAIITSSLIGYVESLGGYQTIVAGSVVDLKHPMLWSSANVAANATFANAYEIYPTQSLRNNFASFSGTAYYTVYIYGTLVNNSLTVVGATTTIPTTEDGYVYIPLGQLYSEYQLAFRTSTAKYAYLDGAFQPVEWAVKTQTARTITKVSEIEHNVDGITTRVGSLETTTTKLRGDFDNLELGGRNLLLGTGTEKTSPALTLNSSDYAAYDFYALCAPHAQLFAEDDLLTISFDWSCTATGGTIRVECGAASPWVWGTLISAVGTRNESSNYIDVTSTNISGHVVLVYKATVATAAAADTFKWLRLRMDGTAWSGKTVTLSNAKVERGNKPTDWTPAPEDSTAEIETVSNRLTTVEQNVSGITTRVSDVESTTTTLRNDLDGLEIGGRNLWGYGSQCESLDGMTVSGAWDITTENGFVCAHATGALKTTHALISKLPFIPKAREYVTISGYVLIKNISYGTTNPMCEFYPGGQTINGTWRSQDFIGIYLDGIQLQDITSSQRRFTNYISDSNWHHVAMVLRWVNAEFTSQCSPSVYLRDCTGDLYVRHLKYERGNKATDWSPAPEDTNEYVSQRIQSNLAPFLSMSIEDIYNASTNPDGYWKTNRTSDTTQLADGWAHIERNNTGTSTVYPTFYESAVWRNAHGGLKPNEIYTVLIEIRNAVITGNVTISGITAHTSTDRSMFSNSSESVLVADGVYYVTANTKDDTTASNITNSTRALITMPAGSSIACDLRMSLYEGRYFGPYKPYIPSSEALKSASDIKSITTRVSQAESTIEQHSDSIALKANSADVYTKQQSDGLISTEVTNRNAAITAATNAINLSVSKVEKKAETIDGNILYDTDVSSLTKVYGPANRYFSDAGNASFMVCDIRAIENAPAAGLDYMAHWSVTDSTSNKQRGLCFYSGNYIQFVTGQKYTLSCWVRCTSGKFAYCVQTIDTSFPASSGLRTIDSSESNTWQFVTTTVTANKTQLDRVYFMVRTLADSLSFECDMCGFKLTAAAYATQTELDAAKAEIKVTTDGISSEVSKVSSAKYLVSSNANGWPLSSIKTWAAEGYTGNWTVQDVSNVRIGDVVYVKGIDSTRNCDVYIKGTVTAIDATNRKITMTSHGYEDILPIDTIKSTINQSSDSVKIQAKHIEIDGTAVFTNSDFQTKLTETIDAIEVGGRNLLPWSTPSSENLAKIATPSATNSFVTEDGYPCYKISGASTNGPQYKSNSKNLVQLSANTQYTYSAWVKLTTTGSTTSTTFNFTHLGHFTVLNTASTASDQSHEDVVSKRIYSPSTVNVGEWTHIQFTFTTNALDGSWFGVYPKHSLGDAYTLFIRDQKLEKGNKATDWTPAPEDQTAYVDSSINDISIGGRNLLQQSFIQKYNFSTNSGTLNTDNYVSSGTVTYSRPATNDMGFYVSNYSVMEGNTDYVISFRAKVTSGEITQLHLFGLQPDNTAASSIYMNGSKIGAFDESITISMTNNIYYSFRMEFKTTSTITSGNYLGHIIQWNKRGAAFTVEMTELKFEKGTKATDWTPAPEDQTAYVDSSVNDISIGGRNLFKSTTPVQKAGTGAMTISNYDSAYHGRTVNVTSVTPVLRINNIISETNVPYTISFTCTASAAGSVSIDIMDNAPQTFNVPAGTSKVVCTSIPTRAVTSTYHFIDIEFSAVGTYKLEDIMVEQSTKPSSWSPAPEDVDSSISTVQTNLDSVNRHCQVGNGANTQTNYWRKFASTRIVTQNTDHSIQFRVQAAGGYSDVKRDGILRAHVRTESPAGTQNLDRTSLEWLSRATGIILSNFVLAIKATSGTAVDVELWCRCPYSWSGYQFFVDFEATRTDITPNLWTLYNSWTADGESAPTSGYTLIESIDTNAAQATADAAAPKTQAVKRTQRIYYRTSSSTAPTSEFLPTTWVTQTGNKWSSTNTSVANWTTKVTPVLDSSNSSATKCLYLFTCEQREMVDGTLAYTNVLLDDSTTVIDGGNIITGSVTANQLAANSVIASKIAAGAITAQKLNIGDTANYSNLDINTADYYGFTYDSTSTGRWFTMKTLKRDTPISPQYDCKGGEKFQVSFEVSSTVMGRESTSATSDVYLLTAVGLYCVDGAGAALSWPTSVSTRSSSAGTATIVNCEVNLDANARAFYVAIQLNGWPNVAPMSGTFKIRNLKVYKKTGGELIVDGSITADKIATDAISIGMVTNLETTLNGKQAAGDYATKTQAQSYVNNLEIGGRNLARATPYSYAANAYYVYNIPTTVSIKDFEVGDSVTIQLWGVEVDANSSGVHVYWGGGNRDYTGPVMPDANGYIRHTHEITQADYDHSTAANKRVQIYNFTNGHEGSSLSIERWKIERGSKATDWTPAPEDQTDYVDESVNGISIGGRNLVRNGDFTSGTTYWTKDGSTATVETDSTRGSVLKVVTNSGNCRVYPEVNSSFTHASDENYTISFYAKASAAGSLIVNRGGGADPYGPFDLTTSWQRFTGTIKSSGTGSLTFKMAAGSTFYLSDVMLVHGNKPMDYSPDPRDVEADATNKANEAAKTASNYIYADSSGIRIASASPSSQKQRLQLTNSAANFYTSDDIQRIGINSSSGVTVGNPAKGRVVVTDAGITIYDTNSKKRAAVGTGGLTVYDASEVDVGNFGATARLGKSNNSRFLMNADSLQAYNSSNVKYFEVSSSGMSFGSNAVAKSSDIPTTVAELTDSSNYLTTTAASNSYLTKTDASSTYATGVSLANEVGRRKAIYGTCATAAATTPKAVTLANYELDNGKIFTVKFTYANTKADKIQLNVNSTGAKDVWAGGAVTSPTNQLLWAAGAEVSFYYDGAEFVVVNEPRSWYGACSTATATAAKTDTTPVEKCVICRGTKMILAMTNTNTATAPTLNIRSTGAKDIYAGSGTTRPLVSNGLSWAAGFTQEFIFDGAAWRVNDTSASSNYVTVDDTGIKIHLNSNPNTFQHQTATGTTFYVNNKKRSAVDSSGLHVYVEDTELEAAKFTADGAVIGLSGKSHIEMDYHSLKLIDKGNIAYLHVSDLRDSTGQASLQQRFDAPIAAGTTMNFGIPASSSNYTVTINTTQDTQPTITKYDTGIKVGSPGLTNGYIDVEYTSDHSSAVGFTYGDRNSSYAIGGASSTLGLSLAASGMASTATGMFSHATATTAHAEGSGTTASGFASHSEGNSTTASAAGSHAEGRNTAASASHAHAEGAETIASDTSAHAEGYGSEACGPISHAEGYHTLASGERSHAGGYYTQAIGTNQTVIGAYNDPDTESLFIIGCGAGNASRRNALTVGSDGKIQTLNGPVSAIKTLVEGSYQKNYVTDIRVVTGPNMVKYNGFIFKCQDEGGNITYTTLYGPFARNTPYQFNVTSMGVDKTVGLMFRSKTYVLNDGLLSVATNNGNYKYGRATLSNSGTLAWNYSNEVDVITVYGMI